MKCLLLSLLTVLSLPLHSQSLQLHYDFRHSLDPERNSRNFPAISFEYFKFQDSGSSGIQPGSFLLKVQGDFLGEQSNIGKIFLQASQSVRFWKPAIYIDFQYSGGLGVAEPGSFGYYISSAYSVGVAAPFQWAGAVLSASLCYTYNALTLPSHDLRGTLYWWKGFWNYTLEFSGDLQFWTLNKNHGDSFAPAEQGKTICLFGEPQLWYNVTGALSIGTRINLYYHVLTSDDAFQVYPTIAIRVKI